MQINIRNKIRSLIRRNEQFFCFSYSWESKQIIVHRNYQEYFSHINEHLQNGLVKRTQCYLDETIQVGNGEQYLIYWVSFGDFRRTKMVNGQNPIAKGFGVCAFDFVYFFVEPRFFAHQKIKLRIKQLQKQENWFYSNLMKQIYSKHFERDQGMEEQFNEQSFGEYKKSAQQSYTKFPIQKNIQINNDEQRIFSHHCLPRDSQFKQIQQSYSNQSEQI